MKESSIQYRYSISSLWIQTSLGIPARADKCHKHNDHNQWIKITQTVLSARNIVQYCNLWLVDTVPCPDYSCLGDSKNHNGNQLNEHDWFWSSIRYKKRILVEILDHRPLILLVPWHIGSPDQWSSFIVLISSLSRTHTVSLWFLVHGLHSSSSWS